VKWRDLEREMEERWRYLAEVGLELGYYEGKRM
jgi:hypothetical protein